MDRSLWRTVGFNWVHKELVSLEDTKRFPSTPSYKGTSGRYLPASQENLPSQPVILPPWSSLQPLELWENWLPLSRAGRLDMHGASRTASGPISYFTVTYHLSSSALSKGKRAWEGGEKAFCKVCSQKLFEISGVINSGSQSTEKNGCL